MRQCFSVGGILGVKRVMAAEFSRELSAKVHAGQLRLAALGFRQGGTLELQPFERIIDFCGGGKREVQESIQAYSEMEKYYRPRVDEGKYDLTRFSGFVEPQKPKVKDAIYGNGFGLEHFAGWIHDRLIDPLSTVRQLPSVLSDPKARQVLHIGGAQCESTWSFQDQSDFRPQELLDLLARRQGN